jgi:ubiquinone biosynthesis UbiH/UbiF/VisC/COQ6 family hydroxylase
MAPRTADDFDVTVAGTGVAGLAAALGCAQAGLRVALLGPAPRAFAPGPEQPFDARIYAIAPGTVEFLERLRIWPQVDAARLQPVARMRIFGDAGNELTFDAWTAHAERLATIGEEAELLRLLSAACGFAPAISQRRIELDGLQVEADAVRVRLADGGELRCRLVIGADGAQSAVRAAAGISASVAPYHQSAVVANFACERGHDETAFQWFTGQGVVALLPLPQRHVSLVWSAPQALADELAALSPAALAERVMHRTGAPLGRLVAAGAVRAFALRKLTVDRLVVPRVALVGDAAHVVHPLAGQGLNLGLQDVSELLRVLADREPFRDVGDLVLLRRYARRRAEPIELMRATTDGLAKLFAPDDPALRRLRNAGLSVVDTLVPLKRALMRHALG